MIRDDSSSLEIGGGVQIEPKALRIHFSRASGPGGQNVNKVNTRAELWVSLSDIVGLRESALARLRIIGSAYITDAGEIHIASGMYRSQERNRAEVLDKLRELVLRAMIEPKHRRKTRPTASSRRRRLDAKRRRGVIKIDRRPSGGDD
jgi:ribosome-associated protein